MNVFLVAVVAFAVLFFVVVESAAIGSLGAIVSGEEIRRCPRCHRFGLTHHHEIHKEGCKQHEAPHQVLDSHASSPAWSHVPSLRGHRH